LHAKGDHFNNINMTIESYNRQLIRNTNIYSKMMSSYIKNSEKQMELLNILPKDATLLEIQSFLVDLNADIG
jgi:hypothetical protein